jgi:hypothetical protein
MAEEDNIFEERSADEIRKDREEAIVYNVLNKILPNAADWATEEILFPLYAPTALLKYSMELVGGPPIPPASAINNFMGALQAEEYAAGTGPIQEGTYDVASSGVGLLGGAIVYEAALDKIKANNPKVYKQLTRMFPYFVDHVHNRAPGILKNVKGATKGTKALNFVKGFGSQIKHMALPSKDVMLRALRNSANIAKAGTGIGLVSNLLSSTELGDGTIDGPLKNMAAFKFSQHYGMNIKPEDVSINDIGYITINNPSINGELYNKGLISGTGAPSILYDDMFNFIHGDGNYMVTQEDADKASEEYQTEKERYEKLPINRKAGEYLGEFFTDVGSRKLPQDIKNVAGLPKNLFNNLMAMPLVSSSVESFKKGVGIGQDEEPYDAFTMTNEGIIAEAKDMAENEQYMTDKMNQTLQSAPFIDNALEINLNVGDKIPANMRVDNLAMGGEPGQFTDSMITGLEEDVNVNDIINQPGFESMSDFDVFEEARKKGYEEVEVAGRSSLFGKAPIWAVGDVPKPKIGTQDLTKAEKKLLDSISIKILDDTDQSIIDSPEISESAFYSGLEARLMDPNTPKTFNSTEDFYKFLQSKQISKKEIEDNILENYLAIATKNKTPLVKEDMLKIVRQAPMRKVDSITYGTVDYNGDKPAIYTSYKESGEIPGSYRESVLYLDPKYIPQDPDSLPRSSHDFNERYVIGWSRLTDRNATLPVEKTKQGIAATVDPAMIRTLKRNSTKLKNQLKGLEASAYEKIRRALDGDLTPTDEMNARMIRETIDSRMTFLEEIDMPLANQIRQFRSKIQDDSVRLGEMEASTQGKKVVVTFADEIQSDILQQAKELENELRQQLGSILDLPVERRAGALAQERTRYSGSARNVEPEVLDFYTKNETIFRPMFNTAEEMQSFVDEFQKNKVAIDVVAKGGPAPSDEAIKAMNIAIKKEQKMLEELNIGLSEGAMKQLFPNVPFKNREEWGDILVKRDLTEAAQRLFMDKVDGAAEWYAVSPADLIKKRYASAGLNKGGTNTSLAERQAAKEKGEKLKGIGVEEFYGGPDSVDTKGKHYTSSLEKSLKRAAKENNSEFKIIEVDGVGKVFAIKLTPEMLLPHKTHRKDGGMVYTPELIDIFEAA